MMMYKQQQSQSGSPFGMQGPQQSVYQNDELSRLLVDLHSKIETLIPKFPVGSVLRPILEKILNTIQSAKFNISDSIKLIGFSVEGNTTFNR